MTYFSKRLASCRRYWEASPPGCSIAWYGRVSAASLLHRRSIVGQTRSSTSLSRNSRFRSHVAWTPVLSDASAPSDGSVLRDIPADVPSQDFVDKGLIPDVASA